MICKLHPLFVVSKITSVQRHEGKGIGDGDNYVFAIELEIIYEAKSQIVCSFGALVQSCSIFMRQVTIANRNLP